MTRQAVMFMMLSWAFVLGLTAWSFGRILRHGRREPSPTEADPDA